MHLRQWGKHPVVTWSGDEAKFPADAAASLRRAREAGVTFLVRAASSLGLRHRRPARPGQRASAAKARWRSGPRRMAETAPVLAVDLPSGLDADTGSGAALRATYTLSLLTLKPGLFTAAGATPAARSGSTTWACRRRGIAHRLVVRAAGAIARACTPATKAAMATWPSSAARRAWQAPLCWPRRPRCMPAPAGCSRPCSTTGRRRVDATQPDLMLRPWDSLDLAAMTVACGCGGGDAVRAVLPQGAVDLAGAGARCRRAERDRRRYATAITAAGALRGGAAPRC